ncbi:TetR/AcrR family transcriptional regulator [Neobacillus niacini]|uniref:TetR/AcrR family transcriptional regulator n=1 Tax=Neobacillus niacini TaxID=86668 RepID=UPI0005F014C2|nr:TetR/AcrR family transcriptional regulator [Neobacillus niacini]
MTSNQIKEVALIHFAKHGYEGTSMALIAEDVGIKKQSIYTHFKGKDDLFLQVCRDVFSEQIRFIMEFVECNKTKKLEELLYELLLKYKERYDRDDSTKFWLRISFFPPNHLSEQIIKLVYETLDHIEDIIFPIIEKAMNEGEISSEVGPKRATAAYMGVLDGIFVEMIYGGTNRLNKRIESSWYLYWRGLSIG